MIKLINSLLLITLTYNAYAKSDLSIRQDLKRIVQKTHRHLSFHGNILVKRGDKELLKQSFGQAIREWNVPHTLDSKFMIASLSKQFTAFAILQLEEQGKLSLDDSIATYVSLPKNSPIDQKQWQKITLRHLLTHSAGLIRDVARTPFMSTSDYNHLSAIVTNMLMHKKAIFKPTGEFYYSNFGYLLLAQVIENVSKSFYGSFLRKHIFNKLRMYDTGEFHRRKSIQYMSDGYFYNDSNRVSKRCCHDATVFTGSHSLYSNLSNLSNWWQEIHVNKGVFPKKLIEKFLTIQFQGKDGQNYGFGLFSDVFSGVERVYHTGHEWGFVSLISYVKDLDLTIIYLSNSHGQDIMGFTPNNEKFHQEIIKYFQQHKELVD
jgi:CubicO group peptidase (beta-lactamase class C family)